MDQEGRTASAAAPIEETSAKPQGRVISEEEGVHKEWYDRARTMTMETLPAFLEELTTAYQHDYGTICHAISAAAVGAAWAVVRSPQGGITGFQASCIMWGFVTHWMQKTGQPMRFVEFENMLYPQYHDEFTTISKETWDWLQEQARAKLAGCSAHSDVVAHWESIARGVVPFGFRVTD